jgi:NADH:ubiquinone oxidoreductase subunit 6 (subunit J)
MLNSLFSIFFFDALDLFYTIILTAPLLAIIFLSNMVHVLLWVIIIFTFSSVFFLFISSLYISIIFFIVYISGISLVFLFVIMSFQLDKTKIDNAFTLLSLTLVIFSLIFFSIIFISIDFQNITDNDILFTLNKKDHFLEIYKIGFLLYNTLYINTFFFFLIFLFISILITIDLTNYRRSYVLTLIQTLQNFRENKYNHIKIYKK